MKVLMKFGLAIGLSLSLSAIASAKAKTTDKSKSQRNLAQYSAKTGLDIFKYELKKDETSARLFEIAKKTIPKSKTIYAPGTCGEGDCGLNDGGCAPTTINNKAVYFCKAMVVEPGGVSAYWLYLIAGNQTQLDLNEIFKLPVESEN